MCFAWFESFYARTRVASSGLESFQKQKSWVISRKTAAGAWHSNGHWMDECLKRGLFTNGDAKKRAEDAEGKRRTRPEECLLTRKRAKPECFYAEKSCILLVLGSCGKQQVVFCSEQAPWMETGGGKEAGRAARKRLWLVRSLLRWPKPRLWNDIFSHPSNKLHIQRIAGPLPNHFFPLQSLKKLHLVGLDYRDIMQEMPDLSEAPHLCVTTVCI